jgi:hypothetical protein
MECIHLTQGSCEHIVMNLAVPWNERLAASQGLSSMELLVNKMYRGQSWECGLRALELTLSFLLRLHNEMRHEDCFLPLFPHDKTSFHKQIQSFITGHWTGLEEFLPH